MPRCFFLNKKPTKVEGPFTIATVIQSKATKTKECQVETEIRAAATLCQDVQYDEVANLLNMANRDKQASKIKPEKGKTFLEFSFLWMAT